MQELENWNSELSEDQKFCITHQIAHLKNKDTLKTTAFQIGITVLSLFPWIRAVRVGLSFSSLLAAYEGSFLIQAIGTVFLINGYGIFHSIHSHRIRTDRFFL